MWYTVTLVAGILLLISSLFALRESLEFLRNSERAVATVIDLEHIKGSDGDITFKPVFKFITNSDQEMIYRHHSSSKPAAWQFGEQATIAYNAAKPSEARLMTYFGVFNWAIILMSVAMPMIVIGGGYHLSQAVLKV
ncbi:DUF3592 domain-containing protein [Terrimonas sp. NA20]|uniref:DUF3592 domain-containing protein n=1 Tax=Terrimonas ginsenosidimutans TaxID=2908004 RepID=A0ABS9KMC2_9BACT|nr:DUF3592 domain-containing protein [Terrimonas ginsenosidimutans]MCG2613476.1 DUF3592 domain-containing protein [Terrimonas ginsenosidimutans]